MAAFLNLLLTQAQQQAQKQESIKEAPRDRILLRLVATESRFDLGRDLPEIPFDFRGSPSFCTLCRIA